MKNNENLTYFLLGFSFLFIFEKYKKMKTHENLTYFVLGFSFLKNIIKLKFQLVRGSNLNFHMIFHMEISVYCIQCVVYCV